MAINMKDVEREMDYSAFEALSNVHVLGASVCHRVYTANPKINNPNLMATVKALDKAVRIACASSIHLQKRVIELEKRALQSVSVRGETWRDEKGHTATRGVNNALTEREFLYRLARHVENAEGSNAVKWGVEGGRLIKEIRGYNPALYDSYALALALHTIDQGSCGDCTDCEDCEDRDLCGEYQSYREGTISDCDDCDHCEKYESCREGGQRQCQYPSF